MARAHRGRQTGIFRDLESKLQKFKLTSGVFVEELRDEECVAAYGGEITGGGDTGSTTDSVSAILMA